MPRKYWSDFQICSHQFYINKNKTLQGQSNHQNRWLNWLAHCDCFVFAYAHNIRHSKYDPQKWVGEYNIWLIHFTNVSWIFYKKLFFITSCLFINDITIILIHWSYNHIIEFHMTKNDVFGIFFCNIEQLK